MHDNLARRPEGPFSLYGIRLHSCWQIPHPCPGTVSTILDMELVEGSASLFSRISAAVSLDPEAWFGRALLGDGSVYLRWRDLFEFLVSADGRTIIVRPQGKGSREAFEAFYAYILGQVLSFALLKQGVEPLHGVVVTRNGGAVAFLGDCGYGKSTLGAALVQAGYRLLTDDLLVLQEEDQGFLAWPGPPRLKLFPETAHRLLGRDDLGTPMSSLTPKIMIPLPPEQYCAAPTPLQAIYVLRPPRREAGPRVAKRKLSPRQAFLAIMANTFNTVVQDPARLARNFTFASRLTERMPLKSLSYPREWSRFPEVVEMIRNDLAPGLAPVSP